MHIMQAANAGASFNAARLVADARAAQRGVRAAQDRLFRIFKLHGATPLQLRRSSSPYRRHPSPSPAPRRRSARQRRARAPARPSADPDGGSPHGQELCWSSSWGRAYSEVSGDAAVSDAAAPSTEARTR
jgi:hypothetical protein